MDGADFNTSNEFSFNVNPLHDYFTRYRGKNRRKQFIFNVHNFF